MARPQRHGPGRLGSRIARRLVRRRRQPRPSGRGATRGSVGRHPVHARAGLRRAVHGRVGADLAYEPGHVWQYETGDDKGDHAVYPDGAWLGYERGSATTSCGWSPTTAPTVEEVLASFVRNTSVDANGCAAPPTDSGPELAEGLVRLCRYGIDDWLEQSEMLTGQDAADALAALEAAPAKGDRMCTMALTGPVVLVSSADAQGRVTLGRLPRLQLGRRRARPDRRRPLLGALAGLERGRRGRRADARRVPAVGGSLRRRTGRTCERRIRPVLLQGRPGWPAYLSWFPWLVPRAHRSVEARS